jgi:hypothetical protein|tara:strand:+ start:4118 stop:4441 length:324 start_codon:yes stop_codon:yes gene_type:complete
LLSHKNHTKSSLLLSLFLSELFLTDELTNDTFTLLLSVIRVVVIGESETDFVVVVVVCIENKKTPKIIEQRWGWRQSHLSRDDGQFFFYVFYEQPKTATRTRRAKND